MELYERIQKVLRFRDMSQAEVCRLTGLSSAKVSQVVSGKTSDPRISTIVPIAKALDVSLDYLVFGKQASSPFIGEEQEELNDRFESLNDRGRARLLEEAEMMTRSEMFAKSEDNQVQRTA